MLPDRTTLGLVLGVLALLGGASGVGHILRRQVDSGLNPLVVAQFNRRIVVWWCMCAALAGAFLLGRYATVILFGLLSFWALREFVTVTPTRMADHRALFWVFFVFTPLQYLLVALNREQLYSVLIPVWGFLFIPARIALAGDFKRFLERSAKIQAGLMICVYCLSYAPAILSLDRNEIRRASLNVSRLPADRAAVASSAAASPSDPVDARNQNARLLFFFILVAQLADVLQLAAEKIFGQHVIAPAISAGRTWEGFLGGVGSATLVGMALTWATPFHLLQVALLSMAIGVMGFAGGLTMSAIKRDRGVKDYGTLVAGHGGVLDRIDSICFAAPVFYQLCKYIYALGG